MQIRHSSSYLVVLLSIWLGWGQTGIADEPFPSLDDLLKQYRTLGLPLPPKEAKLVRYETGGGGIVNREVQPKVYGLAFEVKPGTNTENSVLLTGIFEWPAHWNPPLQEVKGDPTAVRDLFLNSGDKLVLAIQCHARDWDQLAESLVQKWQKDSDRLPKKRLIQLAWFYWESKLTRSKIDRAPIAKRLKELLHQDKTLNTEQNRALLKSLDLALVPSPDYSPKVVASSS